MKQINELGTTLAVTEAKRSGVLQLILTGKVVPGSRNIFALVMEIRSSQTSVVTRATLRNIPGNGILPSHRCENLKSA
jgi:hypothetical protein